MGFQGGTSGNEPTCQGRRHKRCGFNPWGQEDPLGEGMAATPAFLPGESHGQRSLADYSPQGAESDTTARLSTYGAAVSSGGAAFRAGPGALHASRMAPITPQ